MDRRNLYLSSIFFNYVHKGINLYKNPQSNDNPNTFVSHCTSLWNWHNPTFLSVCLEFVDFTVPLVNRRSSGNKMSLRYSQHNINVTRLIDCTLPRLTFSKYLQNPDNPRSSSDNFRHSQCLIDYLGTSSHK